MNIKLQICITAWLWNPVIDFSVYRAGHTALYSLITAKTSRKVICREADDVVHVDVEFKRATVDL